MILMATITLTKYKFLYKSMSNLHKNLSTGSTRTDETIFNITEDGKKTAWKSI